MKNYILLLICLISASVNSSEKYEPPAGFKTEKHISGYEHKFYLATEQYMNEFALKLEEANIPFVRYKSGAIGYKSKDKEKVQNIGDDLARKYFNSK
jgi:reverse gyrase